MGHDDEEAIIPHASDKNTHYDPLGVGGDKHGGEHSRKHRRSKSRSSGRRTSVGNPTRNGKDEEHTRASCKATANACAKGQFISSSLCALCHQ